MAGRIEEPAPEQRLSTHPGGVNRDSLFPIFERTIETSAAPTGGVPPGCPATAICTPCANIYLGKLGAKMLENGRRSRAWSLGARSGSCLRLERLRWRRWAPEWLLRRRLGRRVEHLSLDHAGFTRGRTSEPTKPLLDERSTSNGTSCTGSPTLAEKADRPLSALPRHYIRFYAIPAFSFHPGDVILQV